LGGAGGDGLIMPPPFSPDPAEPTGPRPDGDPAPSTKTQVNQPTNQQPGEPPTVITGSQSRPDIDGKLGEYLSGRRLGHFELIEAVGAGGMAAVLKARDLDLGRVVALKILPPDLASDPENVVRFRHEARAAAKLDHENVARVYHFGEDQGLHFIAFEFVEGDNLRQLMDAHGGKLPVPDAVALLLQVVAGLAHAAERGVVHRDIKPSNILVTPNGRAKIVDMGLARSLDPRGHHLAEAGMTLGTFDYISPEQALDPRAADVRSDIYSLGCTFYHALTGQSPVPDGTPAEKLEAQKKLTPPDPRTLNPDIPADLVAVLNRMLAKDPDRRYQDPAHLVAHLRAVARKLGVPTGEAAATPAAKPAQRHTPVAWLVAAVAVSVLALGLILRAVSDRNPGDRTGPGPGPEQKGIVAGPTDPVDPIPPGPVVAEPKDAADVTELVALLRQGVKHIRLTGDDYDLIHYRDRDGQPVEAVLAGDDVRLEGVNRPTVRLGFAPDGKARSKTLTLRGPGEGRGTATVRGVRFMLPGRLGRDEDAGLLVTGFEKVTIEDCTFGPMHRPTQEGPAALAVVLRGGLAALAKCYFAPGCVGLFVDGPGKVTATQCAIAPQHAGVRVGRSEADERPTEVALTNCSALLPNGGTLVEVADQVPVIVRAGLCLVAGPGHYGPFDEPPAVMRQLGEGTPGTKFEPALADGRTLPNGYHHVAAYADVEGTYSFAEALARRKMYDAERPLRHPWAERDPFDLLASGTADPSRPVDARRAARAFGQDLKQKALRADGEPNQILGTRFVGPTPMDPAQLPAPESDARDSTVKVWDPNPETPESPLEGIYKTLAQALAAIRKGDTLLIRHTGRLEVEPHEFTRRDTHLTIKPDAGYKPVLVPAAPGLKRAAGMFKLFGGRLVLDGLHFRLPADRTPAVVVIPGGPQLHLEIRNSVITMEDGEDFSAVALTDPRGEMMMGTAGTMDWPIPKVAMENVFVRGKGRLMSVKGSRPFELDLKNALAALDDPMIDIEPSTADPSSAGSGVVRLNRVTGYLAGGLVHVRAAERKSETAPAGLARTEVTATQCLFVPAGPEAEALVRADRLDNREQLDRWFGYRGEDNVYGYDRKRPFVEVRPADPEANPVVRLDGDKWLELSAEKADPFAKVTWDMLPAGPGREFLDLKPHHFRKAGLEPERPAGAPEVGAPGDVPVPHE
jgi:hypothetical protein